MAAPKVRRLGWLHQPSFKAGQSGTRNAGLVGPTQHSTVYAPRHPPRPEECSQLPPPLQGQRLGWHPRPPATCPPTTARRSEEHTSELQSLMRHSYAVLCLKKNKRTT